MDWVNPVLMTFHSGPEVSTSIASGGYLIHVHAPDIGEKVVKWFGALRPVDLDSF